MFTNALSVNERGFPALLRQWCVDIVSQYLITLSHVLVYLCQANRLTLFLLCNREPSDLPVLAEPKDPPACRVCPEREALLAFLDPKETESVMMGTKC